jgi:hypothetical protein
MFKIEKKPLFFVTKHHKEKAANFLESALDCKVVPIRLDTDQLGTFTQETPRVLSPKECAKAKCQKAFKLLEANYKEAFFVASEGTYGPHPDYPFVLCGEELVYFYDKAQNFELYESALFFDPVCQGDVFETFDELLERLKSWKFPEHALIVKPHHSNDHGIAKGLTHLAALKAAFDHAKNRSLDRKVWVSTDMRAHKNPTRMSHIQKLFEKLAVSLKSFCPNCQVPGFTKSSHSGFLSCMACQGPTSLHLYEHFACRSCGFQEMKPRHDNLKLADPRFCYVCNP